MQTALELYETGLFAHTQPDLTYFSPNQIGNSNAYYPDENIPLTVYPNPADDILQVDIAENSACKISIYSLQGAKMLQTVTIGSKTQIDVSALPDGIYFLQIYSLSNSKRGMKKIVIKH
jgi:hypothetical protein